MKEQIKFDHMVLPKQDIYNCLEHCIISLILQKNKEFELCLCDTYSFNFFISHGDEVNIVECKNNIWKQSEQFYGIRFKSKDYKPDLEKELFKNLNCGYPVIISMDVFWDSTEIKFYQQEHDYSHYRILTGIDYENGKVTLIKWNNKYEISLTEFFCGLQTFSVVYQNENKYNPKDNSIIINEYNNFINMYNNSYEKHLKKILSYLINCLDITKELSSSKHIWKCNIFKAFKKWENSRKKYIKYLNYILHCKIISLDNDIEINIKNIIHIFEISTNYLNYISNFILKEKMLLDNNKSSTDFNLIISRFFEKFIDKEKEISRYIKYY